MSVDLNRYLSKQYSPQPCWELVADFIKTETSSPVILGYVPYTRSIRAMAYDFRLALHSSNHGYLQVSEPVDLCIVLLGKKPGIGIHHCGIYYQGSVMHALPEVTLYEPLSVIHDQWPLVEFWAQAAKAAA